ncbi:exosome complex component MTR3 [Hyalella azteca]|uniref:Exosome complex component MTR3 n=1 Tax=Hyalella azteca TaxID=294128 RepID=A0A8B7N8X0_HYAAZ|nr:exosome complex component MTR3 [Hyalella azteca]
MNYRDSRRNCGPETATPIYVLKSPFNEKEEFLLNDGKRSDDRAPLEVRKMYFGVSNISQAKGSSYVELGSTKVVCGVYGPKEMAPSSIFKSTGQVLCEVKVAPFSSYVRRSPVPDRQVKELSMQVKDALEAAIILEEYPKAQIDVFLTVVEDSGGVLAACVTAASLALCDADIRMYDIVVAASVAWYNDRIYLDPSIEEEECIARAGERLATSKSSASSTEDELEGSNGSVTVALMPLYANGQVATMVMSGSVTAAKLQDGLDAALETCRKVYAIAKQVLIQRVSEAKLPEKLED